MAAWPATLPQSPLADGLTESRDSNVIRSTVDVGEAQLRPRYTAEIKVFSINFVLTTNQVTDLENFYTSTTVFGTQAFTWVHPRTAAAASFRFRTPPDYRPMAQGLWSASFIMEMKL